MSYEPEYCPCCGIEVPCGCPMQIFRSENLRLRHEVLRLTRLAQSLGARLAKAKGRRATELGLNPAALGLDTRLIVVKQEEAAQRPKR